MAIMKMSEEGCASRGEQFAYHFFKKYLPDDFKVYSNVLLFHQGFDGMGHEIEIDFVIFHRNLGLLAVELKDWRIDQIHDVRQDSIQLNYNRVRNNPMKDVRFKAQVLKEKLMECPEFMDYCHRLIMPVHGCCGLPYIRWSEWQERTRALMIRSVESTGICPFTSLFKDDFLDTRFLMDRTHSLSRLRHLRRNAAFEFDWCDGHEHMLDEVLCATYQDESLVGCGR
ncbi:MAG: nuclease-related domain-containing protein [Candidatus Omnitrophota bacterium]